MKIWSISEDVDENFEEVSGLEEPGTGVKVQDPESGIVYQQHGTGVKCILTDHCWLIDHSVAVATENKLIFIVKGGEIKYVCSLRNRYHVIYLFISYDSWVSYSTSTI